MSKTKMLKNTDLSARELEEAINMALKLGRYMNAHDIEECVKK